MRLTLVLFVCLSLYFPAKGQQYLSLDTLLGKEALLADLKAIYSEILAAHPNPYAFVSKEKLNESFERAEASIDSTTSLKTFFAITCSFLRQIKDSHTGPDYEYLQRWWLENKRGIAPIRVISIDGALYTISDADSLIPPGSKLACIDNREAFKFYPDALKYSLIEGNALTGQRRITDALFTSVIGLDFPLGDSLTIDFIPYGEEDIREIKYPVYKKDKWYARQKSLQKEGSRNLSLKFTANDSLAVLKVGTFAPSNIRAQEKYLRSAFKEIKEKNVQYLAVDLRDNGGGHSHQVEVLMSYLKKEGHNTPHNIIAKGSKLARDRSFIEDNGFAKFILKLFFGRNEDVKGFIKMLELQDEKLDTLYFFDKEIQKEKYVYTGNCVLFINGLTASAGVDFANSFYNDKRGLIIGEPCLGPHAGTFGNPASYTMKNSKLKFSISTIRYNYDDRFEYVESPIKPNVLAEVTPELLAIKKDACITAWKKYIKENAKK